MAMVVDGALRITATLIKIQVLRGGLEEAVHMVTARQITDSHPLVVRIQVVVVVVVVVLAQLQESAGPREGEEFCISYRTVPKLCNQKDFIFTLILKFLLQLL